jgi:hypothetical protein
MSRMDAVRVGNAWEYQERVALIIPKDNQGVVVPSRSLRVFMQTGRGHHERMRAWQRR